MAGRIRLVVCSLAANDRIKISADKRRRSLSLGDTLHINLTSALQPIAAYSGE